MPRKAKEESAEYPMLLYRDGVEFVWDGRPVDSFLVNDADEESAALSHGWVRSFGDD